MKVIGWLTTFCLILLGTSQSVSMAHLIEPTSALIVLGFTVSSVSLEYSPKRLMDALATVLSRKGEGQTESEAAAEIFSALARAARVGGAIGAIICVIMVLSVIGEPTQVGPAIATLLITCLYSILLSDLLFQPVAHRLRAQSPTHRVC